MNTKYFRDGNALKDLSELAKVPHNTPICFVTQNQGTIRGNLQFYSPEEVRVKTIPLGCDKYIPGKKIIGWHYCIGKY